MNHSISAEQPLLAIDTSTQWLSLALRHNGHSRLFHQETGNRQSELILPQIAALLDEAGLAVHELAAIAYAQGPGAFTGLRIGIGVAQGLAAPFATPLIGVPTLDAAAYLLPPQPCVLAAADARMNEVFYAWFDTAQRRRLSDYQVGAAAAIRQPENAVGTAAGIGSAFALDQPPPFSGCPDMPEAADFLRLALDGAYPTVAAAQAELLYVRDKIALTAAEQAARRAGAAA